MIQADRLGENRIVLTGWTGPDTARKAKACGARFRKTTKDWTLPLDVPTCRALRAQFGDDLKISRALNAWAKVAIREETKAGLLALGDTAPLRYVPTEAPAIEQATLARSYQRVAAAWGSLTGSFLLADQQGLGKSIETLATIVETAGTTTDTLWHLILCPSVAVSSVWTPEVRRWLAHSHVEVLPLTGTLAERQEALSSYVPPSGVRHVFVVANIESARIKPIYPKGKKKFPRFLAENAVLPALHDRIWDTVIVDECQRAVIKTSGPETQTRGGFMLLSRNTRRRIALSGTPMRGKPEQLWGTLNWLRPDVYTSYWNWVKRYWIVGASPDGYSMSAILGWQEDGKDRLAHDLKPIMLRRTKAEVLPELPPKTYAGTLLDPDDFDSPCGIWLDPLPEQNRQFKMLDDEGLLLFEDGSELMANGTLALYTRQKQLSNAVHEMKDGRLVPTVKSPKYEWLLEWLAQSDGEKIVVASQFTQVIEVFAAGLRAEGYSVATLTGKTSQKKRTEMVEKFQNTDEIQVFMLNTKAGGVALTLDTADYLVLLDETEVPDDQEQVEDRIHRTSRLHNVTIYYLRTLGTLDEEVAWVAAARMSVQQYLLDGARGVSFARALYNTHKEMVGSGNIA